MGKTTIEKVKITNKRLIKQDIEIQNEIAKDDMQEVEVHLIDE